MKCPLKISLCCLFSVLLLNGCNSQTFRLTELEKRAFTEDLKRRTFDYFWEVADTVTWQTDDRYPTHQFTSIAATGFALPAYIIGAANGYISREQAAGRVVNVLEWLWKSRQGSDPEGTTGYRGFFYHFLNYGSGTRYQKVELSTIDTGLLMAGILTCQSWFDRNTETEERIRRLADSLFLRVEWDWAMNGRESMSMGWLPEQGFLPATWNGYNEAMILLLMAMGSPTHQLSGNSWNTWCKTYSWDNYYGQEHINFSPLFGHHYSHMFIDFKGIRDEYLRSRGIDYFDNARRATLSNRAYCIDNPKRFAGYSDAIWGLTACDGPADESRIINGRQVRFTRYAARGASSLYVLDDGTIAPTAAGGSIPYEPEICITALYEMKKKFGDKLYQEYGFKDAFNLTYTYDPDQSDGWFDPDYIGIDQGPILIQLENYETGLIWETLKKNKYIVKGLVEAGFKGGWLESAAKLPGT